MVYNALMARRGTLLRASLAVLVTGFVLLVGVGVFGVLLATGIYVPIWIIYAILSMGRIAAAFIPGIGPYIGIVLGLASQGAGLYTIQFV